MADKKFRIKPPYIAALCLLFMLIIDRLFPSLRVIGYPFTEFGIFFIVVGFTVLFWSFYIFKKNQTPILPGTKPTSMVMEGPYRITRNPMYFGVLLVLIGAAIYIGNVLAALGPIAFFLIIRRTFIPFEEKLMEELFGKKYLKYKEKVRRWL